MSSITSLTDVSQAPTVVLAAILEPIRTPNLPALGSIITQNNLASAPIDLENKMEPKQNLKSSKIKEFFKVMTMSTIELPSNLIWKAHLKMVPI
jgi:hypothetical protein